MSEAQTHPDSAIRRMKTPEFVAMMGMMFATIAFSIDSMLPALPRIAQDLGLEDPNRAQLVLITFVVGLGIGTFVTGPLSDAYGRKPVIVVGAGVYILASAMAAMAPTLELLIAARLLQGLGASGGRVVSMAVLRDLYAGREMARITSFVLMIFTVFPAFAPLIGTGIIAVSSWRGIFVSFILFSVISIGWYAIRQPESLPRSARRPFRAGTIWAALRELVVQPLIRISILVQACCFSMVFATLMSVQGIYEQTYDMGEWMPLYFAGVAVLAGTSSFFNARIVMRLGMRHVITWAFGGFFLTCLLALPLTGIGGKLGFHLFVAWQVGVFFQTGFTIGNIQAMAMEHVGHIGGVASSLIQSTATILAAILATPIGLAFDGTQRPLVIGITLLCGFGLALMLLLARIERRSFA
ncbi:multidrug effflux MFS transporter [Mesobacterium pallidum]|uniref:multidrug effflux MFS transporter n=1 Tax=Mesobacterium pallidum TaxID=2872037 RepID=UPI001EE38CF9|nr:multidrug effflux MFS transporter [Mesobacterium pallidum]